MKTTTTAAATSRSTNKITGYLIQTKRKKGNKQGHSFMAATLFSKHPIWRAQAEIEINEKKGYRDKRNVK